jgi:hypothetical protein
MPHRSWHDGHTTSGWDPIGFALDILDDGVGLAGIRAVFSLMTFVIRASRYRA